MRRRMFARLISRSLRRRASRTAVAVLAALLGASLVAALFTLSRGIEAQAGRELRGYGANLIIAPPEARVATGVGNLEFGFVQGQGLLPQSTAYLVSSAVEKGKIEDFAVFLNGTASAGQTVVPISGVDFVRLRSLRTWWRVAGSWPADESRRVTTEPALVGVTAARVLGLSPGETLDLRSGDRTGTFIVSGIVEAGGAEDKQVFVPLKAAQALLGKDGLSRIEVSALSQDGSLEAVASRLAKVIPEGDVRVVGQVADAEARILGRVKLLLGLVAILVLVAAGLTIASTMTASVMERTREIGLMKALGAGNRRVAGLFLTESALTAVAGGIGGYALGTLLAYAIGRLVFGATIPASALALPVTLATALGVSWAAGALPIRRALSIDPAGTLKGE